MTTSIPLSGPPPIVTPQQAPPTQPAYTTAPAPVVATEPKLEQQPGEPAQRQFEGSDGTQVAIVHEAGSETSLVRVEHFPLFAQYAHTMCHRRKYV